MYSVLLSISSANQIFCIHTPNHIKPSFNIWLSIWLSIVNIQSIFTPVHLIRQHLQLILDIALGRALPTLNEYWQSIRLHHQTPIQYCNKLQATHSLHQVNIYHPSAQLDKPSFNIMYSVRLSIASANRIFCIHLPNHIKPSFNIWLSIRLSIVNIQSIITPIHLIIS